MGTTIQTSARFVIDNQGILTMGLIGIAIVFIATGNQDAANAILCVLLGKYGIEFAYDKAAE